jgi:hemerythrin-like domain-containing protein
VKGEVPVIVREAAERRRFPGDVRQLLLEEAISRARMDLGELKDELHLLYEQAVRLRTDSDAVQLNRRLRRLNRIVRQFVRHWNEHIRREEDDLFPYAAPYLGEDPELVACMEQEHELAQPFIQAFQRTFERTALPVRPEEARRMASFLLQAYAFLKNRCDEEEEMLAVLTDRSIRLDG